MNLRRLAFLAALLVPVTADAANLRVRLQANGGKLVAAKDGGDGAVISDHAETNGWETFTLWDLDGDALEQEDVVMLQSSDGHFVRAINGGGSGVDATSERGLAPERFVISRASGSGPIEHSHAIYLRAQKEYYVSARGGKVFADRKTPGDDERFKLIVVGGFKPPKLSAPFASPGKFTGPIGFDHNAGESASPTSCTGHYGEGFPHCYDQHEGSDFMLKGWFPGMDLQKNEVIAAASGIVLEIADGHADRCFAGPVKEGGSWKPAKHQIICPDNPKHDANFVRVLHENGEVASYFHLKRGTVAVAEGQSIACGQTLGEVGSSGISSSPHLHFDLKRKGAWFDPYAENRWAQLKDRIPQRTCNVPPPPATIGERTCDAVETVFSCANQPARAICDGVTALTGGCVARNWRGECTMTCEDACQTIERTVQRACN